MIFAVRVDIEIVGRGLELENPFQVALTDQNKRQPFVQLVLRHFLVLQIFNYDIFRLKLVVVEKRKREINLVWKRKQLLGHELLVIIVL